MASLLTADNLAALLMLTAMEVVLGIDNVVFISILAGRLPADQRALARNIGLVLALGMRLALLFTISFLIGLTAPLFSAFGRDFSGRDLILLVGGLVLVGKATWEIHDKLEVGHAETAQSAGRSAFLLVVAQILLMDVVFSLDSVLTAVGMVDEIPIMVTAMLISVAVMLLSAGAVSGFVERHPSVKLLALSFLLLIGVMLVAEGTGTHIGKGYIYGSMAFALFVELLNLRYRAKQQQPVALHGRFESERKADGTRAETPFTSTGVAAHAASAGERTKA